MFDEAKPVYLALLTLAVCFGLPMIGTYLLIVASGLRAKMLAEVAAMKKEVD
jgi:hypothetical protein